MTDHAAIISPAEPFTPLDNLRAYDAAGQPVAPMFNKPVSKGTCPVAIETRIVGFSKLRKLLQPEHPYFAGKSGYLASFPRYTHENEPSPDVLYPKIVAMHRDNPYRRLLLNKKAGNITVNRFEQFVDSVGFDAIRVNKIVFPMQREISKYLAAKDSKPGKRKAGVGAAWTMWQRFLVRLYAELPEFDGTAWRVNLHTWSSDKPTEPHYHFHALKPDVVLRDGELIKGPFKVYNSGLQHPFTKSQLLIAKTIWLQVQVNYCKYHAITSAFDAEVMAAGRGKDGFGGLWRLMADAEGTGSGYVNVYVDENTLRLRPGEASDDRRDFMFAIKYNGRHWSENYAEYTHEHPKAKNPPIWLQRYENRARVYGWWAAMDQWIKPELAEVDTREKVSPVDGSNLTYAGRSNTATVQAAIEAGTVGTLEVERGAVVLGALSAADAAWIAAVTWPYDVEKQTSARWEAYELNNEIDLIDWYDENGGV